MPLRVQDGPPAAPATGGVPLRAPLLALAGALAREGAPDRARLLLDHLALLDPADRDVLRALAEAALAAGDPLAALRHLRALQLAGEEFAAHASLAQAAHSAAVAAYNALRAGGAVADCAAVADALTETFPGDVAAAAAAMECRQALGDAATAAARARRVLALQPLHPGANALLADQAAAAGDARGEAAARARLLLDPAGPAHPVARLHDLHAAISRLLLDPLEEADWPLLSALAGAAAQVDPSIPLPEALRPWAAHYQALCIAADPALLTGDTAPAAPHLVGGDGRPWQPAPLPPGPVFLAAADARYLRLYGRLFLRSVLRHADLPCTVVLHAIGGAGRLAELQAMVGIEDPRLLWSADGFDPGAVTTLCQDADGPARLPLAHFQCARFVVAEQLLHALGRPLLVADIDSLLQRGVADLLARHAGDDVVLNRNDGSPQFGSRFTANLLLAQPTEGGRRFLALLRRHLQAALAAPEVTRWVDQCGLQMAWQAALRQAPGTRFGWFDTARDINNVMYRSWQPNPFRFLSLFHGFDLASLPAGIRD
ncbi:hypothetical protein CKO45_18590 [Paracraurococcus ruber]|uniref:Glycosyl transferase family 8 n=1 Tax=Paracraurococcus ruber TaxID=77675 RepID=A0ABS1D2W5_9PROT|nr:hypothetical protein [Paracraurococcus ruber]